MNRDEMLNSLRENVCEVTFTKKDGSEREMTCTLNMHSIDEEYHPKGTDGDQGVKPNLDVVKVFDLANLGWRSFRVESVKNFAVK